MGQRKLRCVSFSRASLGTGDISSILLLQEERNIELCESMGGEVDKAHRLREVGSCGDAGRPVADLLWSIVGSWEVDAVFVESPARLYRDLSELITFRQHCEQHGVELWFSGVKDGYRMGAPRGMEVGGRGSAGVAVDEKLVRRIVKMASDGFAPWEIARRLTRLDD